MSNIKKNPLLGDGKHMVLACRATIEKDDIFHALAIIPHEDGKNREIGQEIPESELIHSIDNEKDFAIYFSNTDAIDVVIDNLLKVKSYIKFDHFKERFTAHIIKKGKVDFKYAELEFNAIKDDIDFEIDDAIYCADECMSAWTE